MRKGEADGQSHRRIQPRLKFYYELGNYYYYKNNLDRALAYYQRALLWIPPTRSTILMSPACSASWANAESISSLRKVTEMDSTSVNPGSGWP